MSLRESEVAALVRRGLQDMPFDGQSVLVLVPDATRTFPVPLFFRLIVEALQGRAKRINFIVALGTHAPLSEEALLKLFGLTADERHTLYGDVGLFNHAWNNPEALCQLGVLSADEIAELSEGRTRQEVAVHINKHVLDHDQLLVCGPVFPHEVVGFSGGNKYFFPGIAGAEIINFTHWLGALVTSYDIIGTVETPVRRVLNRAAQLIPKGRHALCSVIGHGGSVEGVFAGSPEDAYLAAASMSRDHHIVWVDKPYKSALSVLPAMYTDIWVGAKGMYKLEPAMADGGEVIIYAPHISELSHVHGALIRKIGYHVRDYFLRQWDRFRDIPWGVLAHSTHLRGVGTYENGVERPRIQVTLATAISKAECEAVNVGHRDPASIDPKDYAGREAEGVVLIPRAGEHLHRLRRPHA